LPNIPLYLKITPSSRRKTLLETRRLIEISENTRKTALGKATRREKQLGIQKIKEDILTLDDTKRG